MGDVRLVIGMPLYGAGEHLEEALSSILAQTYRDLAVVMTDDHPTADVEAVVARLADPRVSYRANPRRLGLVGNWQRSFEVAIEQHPGAEYFAWASDHDAWHPLWAERLIADLQRNPQAALAYPQTFRMTPDGRTLRTKQARLAIAHEPDPVRRLRQTVHGMSAGNMVYGLFRIPALERAGVLRRVLLPDRLLLTELSLAGDLHQVNERLFYRRSTQTPTIERQRASFWPDGAPRYAQLPWTVQHVGVLSALLVLGRAGPPGAPLRARMMYAGTHATAVACYASRRLVARIYGRVVWRVRHAIRHLVARGAGVACSVDARVRGQRQVQSP